MLCKEIIAVMEQQYAPGYAMEWDNVGLLVGRTDKEVRKIYIALDATDAVIERAIAFGADLLVTHHPLIFGALKRITGEDFLGRRLLRLIRHDIACYAAHTNYDVIGMGALAGRLLQMTDPETLDVTCEAEGRGIGQVQTLAVPITLAACVRQVKDTFGLAAVKVFGELEREITRVAVSPGAGGSMIAAALEKGADVLITGDIDHHQGLDAVAQGLAIIDAGHYGLEHIFIADMQQFLKARLAAVEIAAEPVASPFLIV